LHRANIKKFRVFVQGQNLLTIKPNSTVMQDPETPGAGFPVPKIYTLGFEGKF
jgi:hypothetical protein